LWTGRESAASVVRSATEMRISILCSSKSHPVYPLLEAWRERRAGAHQVELVQSSAQLSGGELLLLVSCEEMIPEQTRSRYAAALVIHASDVPEGRGWSPHVWQILEGRSRIAVTLMTAEDTVDSGAIWGQRWISFEGHELSDEINSRLFAAELELMDFAVDNFGHVTPRVQDARAATYYRRRTAEDSRLDPHKPLAEQFELLRVADPDRYPAFFDHRGYRYSIKLTKKGRTP
jgi:methionyl-tRNA formyltransferase